MAKNEILVIFPYQHKEVWVFDDENTDLFQEPFVSGMPEMIDELVSDITNAKEGFKLFFSKAPFPNFQKKLLRTREEYGGWWYTDITTNKAGKEGWLCGALFKYFAKAPEIIYVKAGASQSP
tara:strand:- start:3118 stop:3483 length:366 start_codon:yes stop_codon:yes gene_type:complete